jgi:hypothetical protein
MTSAPVRLFHVQANTSAAAGEHLRSALSSGPNSVSEHSGALLSHGCKWEPKPGRD